jgi:hypothetical protein
MNSLVELASNPSQMLFMMDMDAPVVWLESLKSFPYSDRRTRP